MAGAFLSKGADADFPTRAIIESILAYQERELDEKRLAEVVDTHQALRPLLRRLREIDLGYLTPIEPGHVLQWIEAGGTKPIR